MRKIYVIALLIFINLVLSFGQVISQWRGPNRDGVYPNEKLMQTWPAEGPKVSLTLNDIGVGYSSPAVTNDRIYISTMFGDMGNLVAYDLSGKLLWKTPYGKERTENYNGARSTPAVTNDKIYLMSTFHQLVCFDLNGKIVWSLELSKEFNAPNIKWGICESILIDGDFIYCTPGSKDVMVAKLNRHTGKTIWKSKGNGQVSTYCSPVVITHNKNEILVTMMARSVVGINPKTGEFLFEQPHITQYDINPNTPYYKNGFLYTVSGYGTGGQMFKVADDGKSITKVWENKILDSQMGATIEYEGYIYGSGQNNRGWHCIDWKTGEVKYTERELGSKGNIIFSDGLLYLYSERGDIAIVKPNPEKFEIVSSFMLKEGSGEHWAHPVIKKGKLYVRHGSVLKVYDIAR